MNFINSIFHYNFFGIVNIPNSTLLCLSFAFTDNIDNYIAAAVDDLLLFSQYLLILNKL